jgi:hypothetical protein
MYEVCHCSSTSYTLTVVHFGGTEEERTVPIEVTGTCNTPTPPPDGTAPPAPSLLSPANGANIDGNPATVTLSWSAVSDESGIAEYRLEAQRHSGDGVWLAAPGSPWNGLSGTSRAIPVQPGWTFRWRVRAVDGAGNVGPWSGWFSFVVVFG